MARWIISADWHINDYANYNYSPNFRLNQFPKVADRVIQIAKLHNSDTLVIAGDFIDVPVNIPKVQAVIKETIDTLKMYFSKIYYIVGQHCMYSKSNHPSHSDTILSLFDDDKFIYMNHQIIEIDGHKIGFQDWTPNQNTDWIGDTHLDVLIGHYTKSTLFGQDIDESKFDLMIHGDIHNKQVIGKFVSVCNPIQHDMKSEVEGGVIVFDTESLNWERELIDPDHTRFLRMSYVEDRELEGFKGPLQYNIYRPKLEIKNEVEDSVDKLTWNDIDDLINIKCNEENLFNIHSEVTSKCKAFNEVDFNFKLTYFEVKGYRSLVDFKVKFSGNDRIALLGDNGTGKSSAIKALKGMFLRNSELKYGQSDFTDYLNLELGLVYQNKLYEITKGDSWGLKIDGQEQSYGGIRDFELDLYAKLPFIEFLDLFFITSDVQNLSAMLSPTRRIELISKFYRLDRLQAYNDTAQSLKSDVSDKIGPLIHELTGKQANLELIKTRLSELDYLKSEDIEEVKSQLKSLHELREKDQTRKLWVKDREGRLSQIDFKKREIHKLKESSSLDIETAEKDRDDLRSQLVMINDAYESQYKNSVEFESQLGKLNDLLSRGTELGSYVKKLTEGRCPTCGAALGHQHSQLISDKQRELNELREEYQKVDQSMKDHPDGKYSKEKYLQILSSLKQRHSELTNKLELLNNKISSWETSKSILDSNEESLANMISSYEEFLLTEPEEVKLPLESLSIESDLNSKISLLSEVERLNSILATTTGEITRLESEIDKLRKSEMDYQRYVQLTAVNGEILEEILIRLANQFSTTDVKYEVSSGVYRKSRFVAFNAYYKVKDKYRLYEDCSDGQKTMCDIDFLSKLFQLRSGLLVLDEHLKFLDRHNFPKAYQILMDMNVNTLILSTHESNLTDYTQRLLFSLDPQGRSEVSCI